MRKLVVAASIIGAMTAVPVIANEGLYLGGRLGGSFLSNACNISGAPCTESGFSAGFFAGYDWNDYIALEFANDLLGSYKTSFVGDGASYIQQDNIGALTLAPKFSYSFTDDWSVFGKVGAAYTSHVDKTSLMGGVGVEYDFATAWSGRLEYQRINKATNDWFNTGIDTVWLGISYSFGKAAAAAQPPAEAPPVAEVLVMTKTFEQVSGQENFAFNVTQLDESNKSDLIPLIALMQENPESTVTITGYTDNTGPEEVNQRVSEERAESMAAYLESQGIDRSRMTVSGMGESNPVATNSTKEGRAQNRRVEFIVPKYEYSIEVLVEQNQ
ncbi:Outer membrane protein A precursor [Vibrio thalassae]|uniref:Outer membrane protein A n=1 Tax=Vibrio thalassae TaxID=1243014 RepID=A0A240EL65_9VIBR|nr:OmpA family protein [Vibrio thalassae]SNX49442.1 Outer membrane protein A precursor [Vibrio thalassae]